MNLSRLLFTLLLLPAFFYVCFSQEKPKAVLVDEFDKANCEDLSARLDGFYIQLKDAPNSNGFIVIYGDKNNQLEKYHTERLLKRMFAFRQISPKLIVFIHGKDGETTRTQFWEVPSGADKPRFEETKWNFELPKIERPFIFHANSWIDEICPAIFSIDFYSQFLLANPKLRGHLVIYEKSLKRFYKIKRDLLNELIKNYKIPTNQIKIFYVRKYTSDVEYWLVPKKKK